MRDVRNIRAVAALGVDIIGLIFYPKSPRYVGEQTVALPTGIDYAGVFVDEKTDVILQRVRAYSLAYVQLHGSEDAEYVEQLRRKLPKEVKIIKAISIGQNHGTFDWQSYVGQADILLFDTQCVGYGGSGEKFDWQWLDKYNGVLPFLLSGGIGPEDAELIKSFRHPRCIGVDLNSRFESAPAVKDIELLRDFISMIDN